MKRALSVKDILDKKYNTFPFEGKWKAAFGTPERVGVWFIWGNSGNGKTSFVMQLCKELCKYDRVLYDSLEEGACLTVQNNLKMHGMSEVSRRLAFIQEDMEALKKRLRQHKSYNIVVVDSFQYTRMSYRDYISLKEAFPNKLFIFISHAQGKNPRGDAAVGLMYDATLKIWVEGGIAFSKGRFKGQTGEYVAYRSWPKNIGATGKKSVCTNDEQEKSLPVRHGTPICRPCAPAMERRRIPLRHPGTAGKNGRTDCD